MNDATWIALSTAVSVAIPVVLVQFMMPLIVKRMDAKSVADALTAADTRIKDERKAADARQDLLAERLVAATEAAADKASKKAEEAAALLLKSNADNIRINTVQAEALHGVELQAKETARLLAASNAQIAIASAAQAVTLKEISDTGKTTHTLVNNNLTVSKKQARDAIVISLASLKRNETLAQRLGEPPDPEIEKAMAAAEIQIAELNAEIAERDKAAAEVDLMQKNQAAENVKTAETTAAEQVSKTI